MYNSWRTCQDQVVGYSNNSYQGTLDKTLEQSINFLNLLLLSTFPRSKTSYKNLDKMLEQSMIMHQVAQKPSDHDR